MTLTDLIAFFALFVALYGAILSTYTAINEFFRLKLSIFDTSKIYITLTKSDEYLGEYGERFNAYYENLYTVIIPIRIINKSKNSTTINEFVLNNTYKINSSTSFDNHIPTSFTRKDNLIIASNWKLFDYPIIKPLFELKPLTTIEGYLIFTNINKIPSCFNVTVRAVQKSKTFHLDFSIANDYRNEQIQEE